MLLAMAAACLTAPAEGQQSSVDSLFRRITYLERRTADLEQRVRELEGIIKTEPSRAQPVPESAKWQDLATWRRLRRGMNEKEVRALLGDPQRVDGGAFTRWSWGVAYVVFYEGKLDRWSEP